MKRRKISGMQTVPGAVPLLVFEQAFGEHVTAGMTTRAGGVSTGIYESMNLGRNRGDDPAAVAENYRRLAHALAVRPERMVLPEQTHTATVRIVDEALLAAHAAGRNVLRDVDGLVTDLTETALLTTYADCVPLYFNDPVRGVIGIAHAGREGTLKNIAAATIRLMVSYYGSCPADIRAAIGPAISQAYYQVERQMGTAFIDRYPDLRDTELITADGPAHCLLDLPGINRRHFSTCGILPEHIFESGICTWTHSNRLFSHRRTAGRRGNMAGFIVKH
ncbi:MAG: peptidoglycan editing factor PgeF [Eubacteriales bacterium]|nr:peptidoglycan editing factor PgeF [Eubacteriales bacterium]